MVSSAKLHERFSLFRECFTLCLVSTFIEKLTTVFRDLMNVLWFSSPYPRILFLLMIKISF